MLKITGRFLLLHNNNLKYTLSNRFLKWIIIKKDIHFSEEKNKVIHFCSEPEIGNSVSVRSFYYYPNCFRKKNMKILAEVWYVSIAIHIRGLFGKF